MVYYYLSCKVSRENVLTAELRNAQRAVVAVRQALAVLARGAPQMFTDPGYTLLNCSLWLYPARRTRICRKVSFK